MAMSVHVMQVFRYEAKLDAYNFLIGKFTNIVRVKISMICQMAVRRTSLLIENEKMQPCFIRKKSFVKIGEN